MNTHTTQNITDIIDHHLSFAEKTVQKYSKQTNLDSQSIALFEHNFIQLWQELTHSFEKLLQELGKKRQNVDTDLKKQVEVTLQICRTDTGIPSISEIERRVQIENSYEIVYEQYLNEVRAHFLQNLLSLEHELGRSLERVKSQIAEILINKTILGKFTASKSSEFIQVLATIIPDQLISTIPSQLKIAFQILAECKLSYREFILYRIRPHIDGLTPKQPETPQLTNSPSAEQIFLNLKIAHAQSLRKCEIALKQLLSEPNELAFAIAEEFVDRTIRTADVENEWQVLLQKVQPNWDDFFAKPEQIQRKWIHSTQQTTDTNIVVSEVDTIFTLMDF
ncbi:hypothetical protein ACE1AT_13350 [Pelatocladus sp. BLCC-F211]|uniref:hypothetical protein n=1 Tax=Pelatocladus sp. BLCC-F211 TaxID=3342752 RepID=UPI0035B99088